ncbi:MAG: DUF4956 domain-containing protein [Lachnospiraceae bacterium]|nr:DUF4956 domain-containing protein [Lachnospiraceae bacterium]
MFTSVLNDTAGIMSITEALLCTGASIGCGFVIALIYMYKSTYTKSFITALVLLPALVQFVIMIVNGNLGTSIAVMGAFALLRFRSVAGNSRDMTALFFSIVVGLSNGMGYITFSFGIVVMVGIVFFLINATSFGESKRKYKNLKILIPENLDYDEVFSDIFDSYLLSVELVKVKTTDLGSMFELSYEIIMKDPKQEKEFIDALRCRNGNLTITCSRPQSKPAEEL